MGTATSTSDPTLIKSIDTFYNGNYFRSRLEARWAVFFDIVGVKYEYEKEGYNLHYSGCYLPDFYLPQYNAFIEIKPDRALGKDEVNKCNELSMATNSSVWMLIGSPLSHRCLAYIGGGLEYTTKCWIVFVTPSENDENTYVLQPQYSGEWYTQEDEELFSEKKSTIRDYDHYESAVRAHKYRFEHKKTAQ